MEWKYTGEANLPDDLYALEVMFARRIHDARIVRPVGGTYLDNLATTMQIAERFAGDYNIGLVIEYARRCRFPYAAHLFHARPFHIASAFVGKDAPLPLALILCCLAAHHEIASPRAAAGTAQPPKGGL